MEGQVASRQTYAKGSWQGADLCPSYDRPLSFQTYAPPMSRPLPQGYAKGQVARSRPLPLLCPSYASFAFACNSKHAFFVFHICDAGGAPIQVLTCCCQYLYFCTSKSSKEEQQQSAGAPDNLFYISISTISPVMCLHMSAKTNCVRAGAYLRMQVRALSSYVRSIVYEHARTCAYAYFTHKRYQGPCFQRALQGEMHGEMQYLQVLQGCGHFLASSFLALVVLPFVCLQRDQEEG
jgi:hypothetical protein